MEGYNDIERLTFPLLSFQKEKKLLEGYNDREREKLIFPLSSHSFQKEKKNWKDTTVEKEKN